MALRDFRRQVKEEVQRDVAALQEIDAQLGAKTSWVNEIFSEGDPQIEYPERRLEHSDIDLKAFKKRLRQKGQNSAVEIPLDESEDEDESDEDKPAKGGEKGGVPAKVAPVPLSGRAALAARRVERLVMRAEVLKGSSGLDDLGTAVTSEAKARLWYDKDQLESHIQQVIDTFDSAVASLEKEKAKLESDLKNADMKLLVLYEELLMLNDLEEKDEALLKKSNKCRNDKAGIMHKIKECQDHPSRRRRRLNNGKQRKRTSRQISLISLERVRRSLVRSSKFTRRRSSAPREKRPWAMMMIWTRKMRKARRTLIWIARRMKTRWRRTFAHKDATCQYTNRFLTSGTRGLIWKTPFRRFRKPSMISREITPNFL
jgi:hypothetical protein